MTTHVPQPTPHRLDATQVSAIHTELRAAARTAYADLDLAARTDLYAGLASVALLDHLRGGRVSTSTLRRLGRHSATAHRALDTVDCLV